MPDSLPVGESRQRAEPSSKNLTSKENQNRQALSEEVVQSKFGSLTGPRSRLSELGSGFCLFEGDLRVVIRILRRRT